MKTYITGSTRLKSRFNIACANQIKQGHIVYGYDGITMVTSVERKPSTFVNDYAITTYAKELHITCNENAEVLTSEGWKKITKLNEGDNLCIKGVFVKQRFSKIKSIRRSRRYTEFCYSLKSRVGNYFANDILMR